jgi:mannan endo-1,4-beta-mannosidase
MMLSLTLAKSHRQYAAWANTTKDGFWTSAAARKLYDAHISHVVNRVNVFTGKPYKDDPTIMAFDIFNEMRCHEDQVAPGEPVCLSW